MVEDHHYGFLHEQLCPCADKWEKIAIGLRFKADEIRRIKCDPMNIAGGSEACLGAVLADWLQWIPGDARGSKKKATLEALKTAVSKAGFGVIAKKLTLSEPPQEDQESAPTVQGNPGKFCCPLHGCRKCVDDPSSF